jgi:hypothetical protein
MEALRKGGALVDICERYNSFTRQRKDLFGFLDLICLQGQKIVGIQATSGSNHAARVKKAMALPELKAWLNTGAGVEIWSYTRRVGYNKNGSKAKVKRWQARVQQIVMDDKGRLEVLPSFYPKTVPSISTARLIPK